MEEQSKATPEITTEITSENEKDATPNIQENGVSQEGQSDETNQEVPEISTFPISVKTCGERKISIPLQVSPSDNIQDIRQFLYESFETCYITSYHLYVDGKKLNDYADISEIPELEPESVLEMREGPYEDRSIRYHVRRFRELISPVPGDTLSIFSRISKQGESKGKNKNEKNKNEKNKNEKGKEEKKDKEEKEDESSELRQVAEKLGGPTAPTPLSAFFPPETSRTPKNLQSLTLSGWNPPPNPRRLVGDLVYLEVKTLEGSHYHITGNTNGFFVNRTTSQVFDPQPSDSGVRAHTLVELLEKLSSQFKSNFRALLKNNFQEHPFEMLPVPFPTTPWVGQHQVHSFDLNRAEDALLSSTETNDVRGQLRDWNEEFQSCRELPSETIQERIIRDRAIVKVNCDFVEAATKGAVSIIQKTVTPINPLDPERAHMFIYNNIFFSYAMDGRDFYKEYGGDRAAYVSVNNDLKGIKAFNQADVKGLCTLATAIVDYRGQRVCAQGIIPGILQREQTSTVVYGSIDSGKKIASDETFHELVCAAGKQLHLKPHRVCSEDDTVALCAPVESKGIVGTDGRRYILDLIRVTPRDMNYTGKTNMLTILRPELVFSYSEFLNDKARRELEAKKKAESKDEEKEGKKEEEKKEEKTEEEKKEEEKKEEKPQVNGEQKAEENESNEEEKFPPLLLNPNACCDFRLGDSQEEIEADEKQLHDLALFLKEKVIPIMVEDFSWFLSVPVDGQTLTLAMHSRGINMRYLGYVAELSESIPSIKELAIQEMITRSAKHVLRSYLCDIEDSNLGPFIAHFLNCLLGNAGDNQGSKKKSSGKKKKKGNQLSSMFSLTPSALWKEIHTQVEERFRFKLPSPSEIGNVIHTVATLRSICIKVGIQVVAKDYDFSSAQPFQSGDVLNLFPVVKHINPESADGRNLLDAGKSFLSQGRLDIAYELLQESLGIFHQVYGPMHKDTANCYSNLAMVLYHAKDNEQALDHQQNAVIISERVLGLDHHETVQNYGNLSLFCHNMGRSKMALTFIKHALYLGRLICGPGHPDVAATYVLSFLSHLTWQTNAAMMLQDVQMHQMAIDYLMEAMKCYETILGPNHIQTGAIYHAIAIAHSQMGEYKEALAYEKKNYSILHEKVGDNDFRAIESNLWLKQFTMKAVQRQKSQLETLKRDFPGTQIKLDQLQGMSAKARSPAVSGTVTPPATTTRSMGERPISEILSYINEKPTGKSFTQRNQKQFYGPGSQAPGSERLKGKKRGGQ